MVAWLDRLTNLASSVRTEVCSPELSHEETTQLGSLRWDRGRGRSDVLDDVLSGGWVEIKLTENAQPVDVRQSKRDICRDLSWQGVADGKDKLADGRARFALAG